jgi:hypothetical protein
MPITGSRIYRKSFVKKVLVASHNGYYVNYGMAIREVGTPDVKTETGIRALP